MFRVTVFGLSVSTTVTVAGALLKFPLLSNVVRVTVFVPRFEHVNVFGTTRILSIAQLSVEALFICEAVIATKPVESR
jgi:hypothetical protein